MRRFSVAVCCAVGLQISAALRIAAGEPAWTELPATPVGQAGHVLWHADGRLLTLGGSYWEGGRRRIVSSAWSLVEKDGHWKNAGALPAARAYMGHGISDGRLYLFGGLGEETPVADVLVGTLDPAGSMRWESDIPLREARAGAAGAFIGTRYYFVGGVATWGEPRTATPAMVSRDVSLGSTPWRTEPALPGPPRFLHAAAALGEVLYVFGGATADPAGTMRTLGDVWRFDAATGRWLRIADLPWPVRSATAVVNGARHILLIGGATDDPSRLRVRTVWNFDVKSGHWQKGPDLPLALSHVRAVVTGNKLIVVGGEPPGQTRSARVVQMYLTGPANPLPAPGAAR